MKNEIKASGLSQQSNGGWATWAQPQAKAMPRNIWPAVEKLLLAYLKMIQ